MKKALFTLMLVCFMCGIMSYFPCKADSVLSFNNEFQMYGHNFHMICASTGTYGGNQNFIKPFAIAYGNPYDSDISRLEFYGYNVTSTVGTIANTLYDNYASKGCWSCNDYYINSFFIANWLDIPLFKVRGETANESADIANAYSYGRGDTFDSSLVIAGSVASWGVDSTNVYNIIPNAFDYTFSFASDTGLVNKDGSWFIRWRQNPNTFDNGVDRIFKFSVTFPSKAWVQEYITQKLGSGTSLNNSLVASVSAAMFKSGLSTINDVPSEYQVTDTVTFDLDYMLSVGDLSDYINFSWETDSGGYQYKLIVKEFIGNNTLGNTSVLSGGIVDKLSNYYDSTTMAFYALPFLNFDYVDCFCIDKTTLKVFNKLNTYYMDLRKSDGTVFVSRDFVTENEITDDDITPSVGSDVSPDVPIVDIPTSQRTSSYNQSIQDSYNNVTNNYYYNYNYNQNVLDYLNKYKDGGSQEDIEDAFGYLNSTLDSLSNVPLLLGKLFNGFFPPAVVILLSSMFVIFVVFLIIRIIKHLFL